jgi:antitoxin component YwqK of YwqJK toxin-antitoxin module
LKFRKFFHGLRIVYDEKGRLHRIENYYAGVLHGQSVWFHEGVRRLEITYQYGVRHGISRDYLRDGKLLQEHEFNQEKLLNTRSFHDNGQPDRWIVAETVQEERDHDGKPIPKK